MKVYYFPQDELPSAVDDAADVMSSYKKETSEEWHNNLMEKYRKIWIEKGCMHWRDDEDK